MSDSASLTGRLECAIHDGDMSLIRQLTDPLGESERERLQAVLAKPARRLAADVLDRLHRRPGPSQPVRIAAVDRVFAHSARHAQDVFAASRLALIAVGSRTQAEWAFVTIQRRWGTYEDYHKAARDRFSYHAAWALARRPAEWAPGLLLEALSVEGDFIWDTDGPLAAGEELFRAAVMPPELLLPALSRAARRYGLHRVDWDDPFWREVLFACLRGVEYRALGELFFDRRFEPKFRQTIGPGSPLRSPLFEIVIRRLVGCARSHEANWWADLLESFAPSADEWGEHSEAALDLLGASSTRAAGVGIEAARKLLASGEISPETLAPALSATLGSEAIGVARGAIELLRASARKQPSLLGESITAALQALSHPKPAVSAAVLNWLESESRWREDSILVDEVALAASSQPEAIASRLRALLPGELAPEPTFQSDELDPGAVLERVTERMQVESDPAWREYLEGCATALQDGIPPPYPPDGAEFWRRGAPYSLPKSAEDTARLLLKQDRFWSHARNFEAILAGMRLPLTPEEPELLGRMLQRCLRANALPMPAGWSWPEFWERTELRPSQMTFKGLFFDANLEALRAGVTQPPLQTPTHDSGYLAPEVLADRVASDRSWGELELLDLGSALYRLAPGISARAEAWERLGPVIESLPHPVRLALSVALGPKEGVETSGQALFQWAVETGFDAADPRRVTPLRLLCAAARARFPTSPAPFLREAIHDPALKPQLTPLNARLTESLFSFGDGEFECCLPRELQSGSIALWEPSMSESAADMDDLRDQIEKRALIVEAQMRLWDSLWVFPELAALHPRPGEYMAVESAFRFPAGARLMLHGYMVVRNRIWDWEALTAVIHAAGNEGGPLRDCLPALQTFASNEKAAVREAATALVQQAFGDGRLTGGEVVEYIVAGLTSQSARPRSLLSVIMPQAEIDADYRLAASIAAQTALSGGGEKELSAADRTAVLESLNGWLAASSRGIEVPAARIVLEQVAQGRSATRSRELAQLILRLPPLNGRPSTVHLLTARDVNVALCLLGTAENSRK